QTVTGQINSNTGTVSFRAVFDNPNYLLTNGNSGTIQIPTFYKNATVVQTSASYERQGQTYVYNVCENNTVASTIITIKDKTDVLYVIDSGVKPGDTLVVTGIRKLKNNTPIKPQKVDFDSIVKPIKTLFQ